VPRAGAERQKQKRRQQPKRFSESQFPDRILALDLLGPTAGEVKNYTIGKDCVNSIFMLIFGLEVIIIEGILMNGEKMALEGERQ
jgi:hypothetical protein